MVAIAMGTLERYQLTEAAREDYLLSYEGERFAESMRQNRGKFPAPLGTSGSLRTKPPIAAAARSLNSWMAE